MSIVKRWEIKMGNHWRLFFYFFLKNKDGEEEQGTLGDVLKRSCSDPATNKKFLIFALSYLSIFKNSSPIDIRNLNLPVIDFIQITLHISACPLRKLPPLIYCTYMN